MAAASDFLEDVILDMVLNSVAYVEPANVFIALYTAAPTDAGGGTEVPLTFDYARFSVPVAGWTITVPTPTRASNTAAITFPPANGGSWGLITAIGIFDAVTSGNLLFHGTLTADKQIDDTDQLEFPIGTLGVAMA